MPNVPPKVPVEKKFDLRTHATDPATQQTKMVNQYRVYFAGPARYFERPVDSGNLWYENDEPAGRLLGFNEKGEIKVDEKAKHIAYVPPLKGSEKLVSDLAAAHAELASIKAEQEKKSAPPAEKLVAAMPAAKPAPKKEPAL